MEMETISNEQFLSLRRPDNDERGVIEATDMTIEGDVTLPGLERLVLTGIIFLGNLALTDPIERAVFKNCRVHGQVTGTLRSQYLALISQSNLFCSASSDHHRQCIARSALLEHLKPPR